MSLGPVARPARAGPARRIAVLGAGNGGQATAAWLAGGGHAVRLFDRFPDAIAGLRDAGRIRATGAFEADVRPEVITDDMAEAVDGAELIVVTVPGFAQEYIATTLAPFLRGGETILLHPGGLGGALEVRHTWDLLGVPADVTLAETDTLLFACRLRGVGEVDVKAVKRHLLLATLPAGRVDAVVAMVRDLFPPVVAAANVLETSLANLNPVIHPVITLLNAGPIERGDTSFDFYGGGVTAATARLLETVDAERLAVAAAAGVAGIALLDWAPIAYGVAAPDLLTLYPLLARDVYQGIGRPANLEARYITEDVPLGMVPLTVIARMVGAPTPRIEAVIEVLSTMNGADYRSTGRTAERMGIAGFGRTDLLRFVETGKGRTPDT